MGIIAISALLLAGIMFAVARHEADYTLPKVLLIAFGLSVCGTLASNALGVFALPVVLGLTAWALHQFCYLRWRMAALVTGIHLACMIGLTLLVGPVPGARSSLSPLPSSARS